MPRLRWLFVFALITLAAFIVGTECFFELRKIVRLQAALEEHSAQMTEQERAIREYEEKIDFYKTKEGIAHLAREQYNLAFPGERVYIIVGASEDKTP